MKYLRMLVGCTNVTANSAGRTETVLKGGIELAVKMAI
jgi:hypothetical protein